MVKRAFNCMKQNAVLFYFIIIVILHTTNVASQFDHKLQKQMMKEWLTYKEIYGKNYSTVAESIRKSVWEQNFLKVLKHNQEAAMGLHNYTLKTNHLADMDIKEYVQEMIKLLKSIRKKNVGSMLSAPHYDPAKIPEELDWREKGYNTPVQNQEDCGACYAFAIASSIEAQHFIKSGQLELLSQQQMVDCSKSTGNMGCRGGSFRNTLRYVEEYGLTASSVYPYRAKESKCKYKKSEKVVGIHSWKILPSQDEYALKVAVATVGPVAVSINASPSTFQLYHEGVYDDKKCTSDQVNHAMLLVGYTKNAWILKNWWSDSWGEKGYMYLKRGQNHCGVANFAAYGIL